MDSEPFLTQIHVFRGPDLNYGLEMISLRSTAPVTTQTIFSESKSKSASLSFFLETYKMCEGIPSGTQNIDNEKNS